jgi:hypothetical protein
MLSKMSRFEKVSDQFQEAFTKEKQNGLTHRQALRKARNLLLSNPSYNSRRK